jgi:ATP-binding cassette subfamily C (CFTR/MRP) protein 1
LSAGEKQLVCICRASIRKAKVVIFDEATANIDVLTEQKIMKLINEDFSDATVITIAHRMNTIINSDKIAVMSYGKLKEYGTPKELLANPKSQFAAMLKEEKKGDDAPDLKRHSTM